MSEDSLQEYTSALYVIKGFFPRLIRSQPYNVSVVVRDEVRRKNRSNRQLNGGTSSLLTPIAAMRPFR